MTKSNAPTNNPTRFELKGGDTTGGTDAVTIPGTEGDADDGWTIPTMSSVLASTFEFAVDVRGHGRYLHLYISPLTTHTVAAIANLFRYDNGSPSDATAAGVDAYIEA